MAGDIARRRGDAELWTQIVLSNHDNLLKSLNKYQQSLSQFIDAVERQDARQIRSWFTQAKERRDCCGKLKFDLLPRNRTARANAWLTKPKISD